MRPRKRADVLRWIGLWGFTWACAVALGGTGAVDGLPVLIGLAGATVLSALATRRERLRALGLAFPVVLLLALTIEYALQPADASAPFSIGILGAAQLTALVWVQAVLRATKPGVVLARLLLVSLMATGAFLVGELAAARVWPRTPHGLVASADSSTPAPYVPDPELQHVHAPGFRGTFVHPEYEHETFETNADGFRDAPWPDAAPAPGELRVLLLGDSTTVGFGVRADETIAARLEELLRERAVDGALRAGPVRVLNGGVAGYSPCHAEIVLGRRLERVRPTHVVCLVYDGNDLEDCRSRLVHATGAAGDPLTPAPAPERRGAGTLFGRTYWYRYSAFYRRLETRLAPFVARAGLVEPDHAYATLLRVTRVPPPPDVVRELELARAAARAMHERCAAASVPFLLARLPARVQTEPGAFAALVRRYGAEQSEHDRTLPGRALLERAAADGVTTLDLLPALEVEGSGPNPFYFLEGHPNRAGNRAIAEALATSIAG